MAHTYIHTYTHVNTRINIYIHTYIQTYPLWKKNDTTLVGPWRFSIPSIRNVEDLLPCLVNQRYIHTYIHTYHPTEISTYKQGILVCRKFSSAKLRATIRILTNFTCVHTSSSRTVGWRGSKPLACRAFTTFNC